MTTAYTSLLGLALPVTGELSGTWGDTVNNSITSLLDSAIAGTTTLSTDADVTLTTTTGAANTSREAILLCSGARTVLRTITAPAQSKIYTVINSTTGGFSVKIVGAGPTTGVTIVAGESALIAWNGSDFIKVSSNASFGALTVTSLTNTGLTSGRVVYSTTGGLETDSANLTFNGTTLTANTLNLTNALGTTYGGTGLTSFTSGGVVYASSTSALATGSALMFDGTNFGVGTAGNAISNQFVNYKGGANANYIQVANGSTGIGATNGLRVGVSSAGLGEIYLQSSTASMVFNTSGNVGIGTSSPSSPLTISKSNATAIAITSGATYPVNAYGATTGATTFAIANSGGTSYFGNEGSTASTTFSGTSAYATILGTSATTSLQFATNGTVRTTLDSSGNLGLGVTPSAWATFDKVFQFGGGALANYGLANNTIVISNAYYSSTGYKYLSNDYATYYEQYAGRHVWYNAPSGTAGNAITFTQAMTLDASGNLGVGETSPSTYNKLTVNDNFGLVNSNSAKKISFWSTLNGVSENAKISVNNDGATTNTGVMSFWTKDGTTLSERARIDSSGRLLVGTTSAFDSAYTMSLKVVAATGGLIIQPGSDNYTAIQFNNAAGVGKGSISVSATATSYNTSSDYRLKNNQALLTGSGAFIDALQPKTWTWAQDGSKGAGFIAHEFAEVSPSSVTGEKDAVDAQGKPVYQAMQASSAEVIANLVAELQSLRKRVAELEAK